MAATNFTPIQLYFSTTASAVPLAANLAQGELAINIADGKLYYEDSAGVVQVIATKGAGTIGGSNTQIQYNNAGALAGNAAMTFNSGTSTTTLTTLNLTNALGATYGGTSQSAYTQGDFLYASASNTLSKLGIGANTYILTSTGSVPQWSAPSSIIVQTATNLAGGLAGSVPYQSALDTTTFLAIGAANRVMTSTGSAPQWVTSLTGLTGVSSSSITNTSLTSGRVVVSTTAGLQADDADLTFDGTTLSAGGFSTTGLSTLVKTVTVGNSSFNGTAVFAAATPAKLYMGTGTVTDVTSAISATNAIGAIASLGITPIAATNTSVTYTNAATLYIAGAPSAGTNVTLTNPYALYVAAGDAYFGGTVTAGTVNLTTLDLTNLEVTNIKAKDGTAAMTIADSTGVVSFTANPILSGGTANGVLYLNGSKVATSGSALSFDGSSLNVASANARIAIIPSTTTNNALVSFTNSAGANPSYVGIDSSGGGLGGAYTYNVWHGGNQAMVFATNNTAAMWLTASATLGIGISNTYGAKLAVLGGALPTASVGLAISSGLSAGRLTSGDTNVSTAYIGQFLDQSITELSAGSSGIYTSGIVAFGGTAAVNPNTVKAYTGGTVRTTTDVNGFSILGGLYATFATGAGVSQIGNASGRAQYQYTTYGGTIGGTDYGWQIGRSPTAGIIADGFYIYDIKASATRLAIDSIGAVKIGSSNSTTAGNLLVLGNGNNTGGVAVINTANANVVGLAISNWDGTTTTNGPRLSFDNSGRAGWIMGGADSSPAFDICNTTWGVPTLRLESGVVTAKGGGIVSSYLMSTSAGNTDNQIVSFYNNGSAYANLFIDGAYLGFKVGGVSRGNFATNGLFNATYGSFADPSLASSGSNGLQILTSAAYNDNSTHQFNQMQDTASIIYVRSSGVCAVPFYPNAGGGIAYQWTALNPQTGAWITGSGPTINFTEASASPNSYSIVFNGGGGSFTIQRTGGTAAYSVYIQRLAQS